MLIASVKYTMDKFIKEMPAEDFAKLLSIWPCADKNGDQKDFWYGRLGKQRITLEEAAAVQELGVALDIEGVDGTMLVKMQGKAREDKYGDITPLDLTNGSVVQIAVPDLGLLQIDQVDYEEDCCTDRVQDKLNAGWRLLAVCPPNAQRRPDYIFGRKSPPSKD